MTVTVLLILFIVTCVLDIITIRILTKTINKLQNDIDGTRINLAMLSDEHSKLKKYVEDNIGTNISTQQQLNTLNARTQQLENAVKILNNGFPVSVNQTQSYL